MLVLVTVPEVLVVVHAVTVEPSTTVVKSVTVIVEVDPPEVVNDSTDIHSVSGILLEVSMVVHASEV